jgi:hypothetical protein
VRFAQERGTQMKRQGEREDDDGSNPPSRSPSRVYDKFSRLDRAKITICSGAREGGPDLSSKNDVVFVFAGTPSSNTGQVMRGPPGDAMKEFAVGVGQVADWFKDFEIESLEVSISAALESGGVTKLFLSAKGEGGFKVTLKPKKRAV